ncbi:hypothetical protein BCR36DRAFT_583000 [Piromyces finnis]|uniref:LysM domain-containing protein n=1 Tax=Piromyces finnis TaxID=1754191 RepID=A0A1Y1VB30_9FUNG|nr:hypothetical protein BCR36DRAFT_583000 [Piromyces finnis]|eukprot:ORX51457.1 hypothetical protein BCR36DRAFT_583000 [Piromyces finnis]
MKLFNLSALVVFFICVAHTFAAGIHCAEHVVLKKGQSCSSLTKLARTKDIYFMNPLINCDKAMTKKTTICVDRDSYYSDEDFDFEYYEIKKGDTCEKLAMQFNTTVDVLKRFNYGVLDCNNMKKLAKYGTEIQYRRDGDYTVNFENSTLVKVK